MLKLHVIWLSSHWNIFKYSLFYLVCCSCLCLLYWQLCVGSDLCDSYFHPPKHPKDFQMVNCDRIYCVTLHLFPHQTQQC